jgi:hypothetical protein
MEKKSDFSSEAAHSNELPHEIERRFDEPVDNVYVGSFPQKRLYARSMSSMSSPVQCSCSATTCVVTNTRVKAFSNYKHKS